jgi:hypothetical protein
LALSQFEFSASLFWQSLQPPLTINSPTRSGNCLISRSEELAGDGGLEGVAIGGDGLFEARGIVLLLVL